MKRNYLKNRREDKLNFIFVGLDFDIKGGREVLEAFNKVSDKDMYLTFISNTPDLIKEKYNKNITFLEPVSREKLLNEIYPKMDIFIMPSLLESFGVVYLEALSFGMGIIATKLYATPEIVIDNVNGKLLHHPFLMPKRYNNYEVLDCIQKRIGEFNRNYRKNGEFYYSLYQELKESIILAKENYKIWQENSIKLYEEKFSEEIWRENFKRIIDDNS
jgi:glycosyltransferase involved in cell wall biosynthesis